jgi:LysR family transcriptional regulator, glycine cleavage system transcriptional activator
MAADPLPSFEALRVFAVAARHGSFSRAAEELHVTHGAVSHRIKSLEDQLRVRLFERRGNNMVLTTEGSQLLASVDLAVLEITRGVERVRNGRNLSELTVSLLPVMAARWLIPRLSRFHASFPDIGINIRTSLTLANFKSDGVDLAIRYGAGRWPGLRAVKLFDEELFPVCSPTFNGGVLPTDPSELLKLPLLRDTNLPWARWFALVGIKLREDVRGTSFTDANLLLQAAISCQGIALARKSVAVDEITSGRLVKLFNQNLTTAFSHFIVYPEESETLPKLSAFREWLLKEALDLGEL